MKTTEHKGSNRVYNVEKGTLTQFCQLDERRFTKVYTRMTRDKRQAPPTQKPVYDWGISGDMDVCECMICANKWDKENNIKIYEWEEMSIKMKDIACDVCGEKEGGYEENKWRQWNSARGNLFITFKMFAFVNEK